MKKVAGLLYGLFLSSAFLAQPTENSKAIALAEVFKNSFNSKQHGLFYKQMSPEFQAALSENDYKGFAESVYKDYGKVTTLIYQSIINGTYQFKSMHEKGNLGMYLTLSAAGKLDGFEMRPWEEKKTGLKKYESDNVKKDRLDSLVEVSVKDYMSNEVNCGLSMAVLKNGQIRYYNYGEIKRDAKQLPTPATIYEIGSISKTFTGLLLSKAIEDGKLKLSDDIRNYLPATCKQLQAGKQTITIQHLATHTSGIPGLPDDLMKGKAYNELNPYAHYTKEQVFAFLSKVKIDEIPGKKFDYSNLGMGLLGIILCDVYKKDYETLVQEIIAKPMQMNLVKLNLKPEEENRFAEGYNERGEATPHWDLGTLPGAGGLRSTSESMMQYIQTNMNTNKGFIPDAHQILFEKERDLVGMAWMIRKLKNGNTLVWHNGGTYGFSSFAGFVKEAECAVVILSNSGVGVDTVALGILKGLQN
jgi:CubicO group peptidase (beta-lactamase class C family)